MVSGWKNDEMISFDEKDENGDGVVTPRLVDDRIEYPDSNPKLKLEVISTGGSDDALAKEKKTGTKLHTDMVKANCARSFLRL